MENAAPPPVPHQVDLLVVGGGINGAGIARDAAGRGLHVLLCEQDDLASHTSSASTKLIHGGLRYLEYYEFGLVRKALQEREVLLRMAPHIIGPLRFVMPHVPGLRPAWMIRAGLFLYDHLSRRKLLPASRGIDLRTHPAGQPLQKKFKRGFVYSDGWVQDARLVVLNVMDAAARGATILTRTRLTGATRGAGGWHAQLQSTRDGREMQVEARAIVNAAGPWVGQVLTDTLHIEAKHQVRMVKGSHIIVRRLFEHDHAYIFQNPDKRIVFAIPYEQDFTLIGTTDVEYTGDPARVAISRYETQYLCDAASQYFVRRVQPSDVISTYAGVRPLLEEEVDNPAAVTRDYTLELDTGNGAPLLSVFGGKITTYRRLAEEAMAQLRAPLGIRAGDWTQGTALPGGDMPRADANAYLARLRQQYPWLPEALAHRFVYTYGTRTEMLLGDASDMAALGGEICPRLYERELRYLMQHEWAVTADDILWRRTKLGLHYDDTARHRLEVWLDQTGQAPTARTRAAAN